MVTTYLDILLKISIQAAVIAVLVFIVSRIARKAPAAWKNALWLVVIIKFLVPPFAQFPSELAFWNVPAKHITQVSTQAVSKPTAITSDAEAKLGTASIEQAPTSPMHVERGRASLMSIRDITLLTWLIGVGLMICIVGIKFIRQMMLVRSSQAADTDIEEVLADAVGCFGSSKLPELRVSTRVCTPMLVGCLKPVILLPSEISQRCSKTDLKAILLHELAHIKRHDMAAMWLQQFAQALFYFHPAVWLAGKEIRREREIACDELVLSKSAIPAKEYAAGYISALKLANGRSTNSTSLAMAEPFDMEKRRLDMIFRSSIPRTTVRWIAGLALIAIIGLPTFAGLTAKRTANAQTLLSHSRQSRENMLSTIKTIKGSAVVWDYDDGEEQPIPVEFALSGNKYSLFMWEPSGVKERITCDGYIVQSLRLNGSKPRTWDVNSIDGRVEVRGFNHYFNGVDQAYPDLNKALLYHKNTPRIVGYETIHGSKCTIVESVQKFPVNGGGTQTETRRLWLDPNRNYAILKFQVWEEGVRCKHKFLQTEVNIKLRNYDGIWLPESYTHTDYLHSYKTHKASISIKTTVKYNSDLAINVPLTDKDLHLPIKTAPKSQSKPAAKIATPSNQPVTQNPQLTAQPKVAESAKTEPTPTAKVQPTPEIRIKSKYGYRTHPITGIYKLHTGIDISTPSGTPILAVKDGKVIKAGWNGPYGNTVIIDQGDNITTLYAHCSKLVVSEGDELHKGQVIGYVGSTGYSTGPQLHFEKRVNGKPVNPINDVSNKLPIIMAKQ